MEKTVSIIVATHKKYRMPDDTMYLPLHVGSTGKENIGYKRDDEGENISVLNPFFCELTGLFWAWKNLNSDYIGLVHYRRHFSLHPHEKNPWDSVLTYTELTPFIPKIAIFVPSKRRYYIETLYSHYAHTHYASQMDTTREIIEALFPEYLQSFDRVVKQRWGYMFNMLIARSDLFSEYCTWLFDVLFELRNRIGKKEDELSSFQARFYGRVSEIIFNVWLDEKLNSGALLRNQLMEIPCRHMEKIDWRKKGLAFLRAKYMGQRYEGSY